MNHTIDTANGFTIQQRGVGHTWMYFMALRDDVAEIKTHSDLGTLKAWCDKQPLASIAERMEAHAQHTSEWKARGCPKDGRPDTVGYEVQAPVGSTLKEIEEKGFTQWALGSSYDEHRADLRGE